MAFVHWSLPIFGASVANDNLEQFVGLLVCCQGRDCSWKMFHWKDIYILHDECSIACCSIMFHRQNALPTSVFLAQKTPHLTNGLRYIYIYNTLLRQFSEILHQLGVSLNAGFSPTNPWDFPGFKNDQPLGCEMGVALFKETSIW